MRADTAAAFVAGADVVYNAIDVFAMDAMRDVTEAGVSAGLCVVHAPVLGFGCAVTVFDPRCSPGFEAYFGPVPDLDDEAVMLSYLRHFGACVFGFVPQLASGTHRLGTNLLTPATVCPSCLLAGALSATALPDALTGRRRFPAVPGSVHIDLLSGRAVRVGRLRRALARLYAGLCLR